MMNREDIHLIIILAVLLNIHPIFTTYLSFRTVSIDFEQEEKPRLSDFEQGKPSFLWESAEVI